MFCWCLLDVLIKFLGQLQEWS
uniref:Uncharacterized protein n=1 Tax=Salix viminalis TaxID=40686 RepID=A0A6N2LMI2_SALVM